MSNNASLCMHRCAVDPRSFVKRSCTCPRVTSLNSRLWQAGWPPEVFKVKARASPDKVSSPQIAVHEPFEAVDGFELSELCQRKPQIKELKLSASSFNSPVQEQWNLRSLEKLQIEINDSAEDAQAADNITRHMDRLYLKELRLVNVGPGFPIVHGHSFAKLHAERLIITGFDVRGAGCLMERQGELTDCILDISMQEIRNFYICQISLCRCRMAFTPLQAMSWRLATFLGVVLAVLLVIGYQCCILPSLAKEFVKYFLLFCLWLLSVAMLLVR